MEKRFGKILAKFKSYEVLILLGTVMSVFKFNLYLNYK